MLQQRGSCEGNASSHYASFVLERAPALLSLLDRESLSRSYGSFDREHWAWKFRDFPLGMMQSAAYPLALLWRYPYPNSHYHGNERLLEWIGGALSETLRRQHRNGSFDAFAPNEQDPGPTLGVLHTLAETYALVSEQLSDELRDHALTAMRAAADFALDRDEAHAFVSNHWALFAVGYHAAGEILGEPRYDRRSREVVQRIIDMQSTDGWYHEYGGPDPGYESLGIFHLAALWSRTQSPELIESLERSVDCFANFVHPDGSVGGPYTSRNTALYFPAGFELLSGTLPMAAAVADFMRDRIRDNNVVTPSTVDAENLPSLAYTYLEACHAKEAPTGDAALPCRQLRGIRQLRDARIAIVGTDACYGVISGQKGGASRWHRRSDGRIAYEDAGYVIRSGRALWSTQHLQSGDRFEVGDTEVVCGAQFHEVRQIQATPLRFVILRLLNLTLFRSLTLGRFLRNAIVRRLIVATKPSSYRVLRTFRIHTDRTEIVDRIEKNGGPAPDAVELPRSFSAIHMGSAKYFHPNELTPLPNGPVDTMSETLQSGPVGEIAFTVGYETPQPYETAGPGVTGPRRLRQE